MTCSTGRAGLHEMTGAVDQAGGYRVRVECGDFFSVEVGDVTTTEEVFTLERFATGRFDVRKDGLRLGSVIGGRRTWCAEIGNRVVGYFKSPRKAGQAIVAEKLNTP